MLSVFQTIWCQVIDEIGKIEALLDYLPGGNGGYHNKPQGKPQLKFQSITSQTQVYGIITTSICSINILLLGLKHIL
jgi:hypothetical protein